MFIWLLEQYFKLNITKILLNTEIDFRVKTIELNDSQFAVCCSKNIIKLWSTREYTIITIYEN